MLRLQFSPAADLELNVLLYQFSLHQNQLFGEPVSSKDWGDELNVAADWTIDDHFTVTATFGVLLPGQAALESVGNNKDWYYTMLYLGYNF